MGQFVEFIEFIEFIVFIMFVGFVGFIVFFVFVEFVELIAFIGLLFFADRCWSIDGYLSCDFKYLINPESSFETSSALL